MSLYYKEHPDYFDMCLKSLSEQTLPADEIVIVFDGPVSQTLENVALSWQKQLPITIVRLEKNQGLGTALNIGLEHCQYELVARMDTDDLCVSDRFEKQIAYLGAHPDIALVGGNITEYSEDLSEVLAQRIVPNSTEDIQKRIVKYNPFNHGTVLFKKEAVTKVGNYQPHLFMEDYNLWLRLVAAGYKLSNLNEFFLKSRSGDNLIGRRKGLVYIKSEYQLAQLKYSLGLQNAFSAGLLFLARSLPRLLPTAILKHVYQFVRKSAAT